MAQRELSEILVRSAERFGVARAARMRDALFSKCNEIAAGLDIGHRRPELPQHLPFRFLTMRPFVIAYDPQTRLVLRIIDGRRDFTNLFG